jgi:hypothetical protein
MSRARLWSQTQPQRVETRPAAQPRFGSRFAALRRIADFNRQAGEPVAGHDSGPLHFSRPCRLNSAIQQTESLRYLNFSLSIPVHPCLSKPHQ